MKTWLNKISRSSKVGFWLTVVGMLVSLAALLVWFIPDEWIGQNRQAWYGWLFFAGLNITTAGMAVNHRSTTKEGAK